jgi:voltage-gated potassium channel
MTIITLSTVGYREVAPLSDNGKLFTAGLIMSGVIIAAYSVGVIGRTLIEGELKRYRRLHKMRKVIASYSNHTIVCGYGRLGRIVVQEMLGENQDVVIIENDSARIEELESLSIPYIEGSAYEDEALIAAGIDRAGHLLALLRTDADNVYVTLCARDLNSNIRIIARTEGESGENKLKRAGANQVIAPYRLSGGRIVQQLLRPNVSDFLAIAQDRMGTELVLEEIVIPENSQLGGMSLERAELRNRTGAMIAALINPDGDMITSPGGDTILEAGATIIIIGTRSSLDRLNQLL